MRVNIATPKKISTIYRNSFRPPNIAIYPIKKIVSYSRNTRGKPENEWTFIFLFDSERSFIF